MAQLSSLEKMVSNALEVVDLKLIRDREDLEDEDATFHPAFAHQVFGENESIFGYKDLRVRIYYTAGSMNIYLGHKYSQRVDDFHGQGLRADDVMGKLSELITTGCYYTSIDEFCTKLDKEEQFRPLGEKVDELVVHDDDSGAEQTFEFYKCDIKTPGFVPFHARLQTFIMWFVDAGSYIDTDDPQWTFYVCYEKYTNASTGKTHYSTVGYTTIYLYYAYPRHIRPRISQMIVLPPYQRLGIGTKFLTVVYAQFQGDERVRDITVEDPSDEFRRIRNVVDVRLCRSLAVFAPDRLRAGFTAAMEKDVKERLKINAKQCRVIYEILRLAATNVDDEEEYRAYRLDVKKRLNIAYNRQRMYMRKLEKSGVDPHLIKASLPTPEERIEQLRNEFQELEDEYQLVLAKIE